MEPLDGVLINAASCEGSERSEACTNDYVDCALPVLRVDGHAVTLNSLNVEKRRFG